MASSFNVYGSKSQAINANVPIWLGTVSPRPVGGVITGVSGSDILIPAGTPVYLANGAITPVAYYAGSTQKKNTLEAINGYLYNDVYLGDLTTDVKATGAVVNFHGEGMLISRVKGIATCGWTVANLKTAVPNVVLIEE